MDARDSISTGAAPTRRQVLRLAGGLGAAAVLPRRAVAAAEPAAPALLTRPIPHGGERVPVIGLGTAVDFDVGADPAKRAALGAVLDTLIAGGGRVIDTASTYGAAEGIVGELVAARGARSRVFLATKLEIDELAGGVEGSLRRLRTDRIDLMMVHNVARPDQSLARLREWQQAGQVRYVGISTSFGGDFAAVEAVLRREKPDFLEINYSIVDREAEKRLLPAAAEIGAAVLPDLPFGRGRAFRAVRGQSLPAWASALGIASWGQFFLKYLIGDPAVTAVIPGTASAAHMADNLAAGRGPMPDPAQRRQMAQLVDSFR